MKKIIAMFLVFIALGIGVGVSSCKKRESVVIYTSTEDYNMELMQKRLKEKFPSYDIEIEYMSTSTVATKAIEEGEKCEADIVYALEYSYLEKMVKSDRAANLKGEFNFVELADGLPSSDYYLPNQKTGAGIIVNNKVLRERGIKKPTSYEDLLKPEFKGLVSMPSPKASGTGYTFYRSLVESWGEQKALDYFDKLSKNIFEFTQSGSKPVNYLVMEEVAVGLGMISQAVEKINGGNNDLEVLIFEEGAPYGMYGSAVIKGKEKKTAVMEVMNYICTEFTNESCSLYYPEQIFKGVEYNDVANFPKNIKYSKMGDFSITIKEELLRKWKY